MKKAKIGIFLAIVLTFISTSLSFGQQVPNISLQISGTNDPKNLSSTIEIILLLTVLSLLPTIIIMMTSFTRVIIVLSFLRNALATQQNPPTQVLIGLAIFLTFFIMAPVGSEIYENSLKPYFDEKITQEEAFDTAMIPLRNFMFKQTRESDISLFLELSKTETKPQSLEDIPNRVLIPAFLISELKTGFQIGFILFIPFIIIDMVVASTLMSMGMIMLPPAMISLPFKILLFILIDGWNLIVRSIVVGFK
ncbi:flagellar biosynthetic protein FliP [Alkalithermobacter thermoalcaliphilus JW-YL-7 = DSM 7308]|uniref:Flagellar biosynthetic protein FliP n=1 Tax=Alkalithermobacter thermoalcaliphilus JW-YL-7 = DSM 7308 TaxID=1121328 RepID=A0A150FQ76_CLOPD|nr:flagellar biosynthetic protein FliP [[Clostridium] paradoxum JW-YL-7 = DSM 7308]SHK60820.1 flagellar biosynthetic protein FliP [[Clostridium] paradoxum JW-YL-7 = DSM 7308]